MGLTYVDLIMQISIYDIGSGANPWRGKGEEAGARARGYQIQLLYIKDIGL